MPFVLRNSSGNLIGFDIKRPTNWQNNWGLKLSFTKSQIPELLEEKQIDLVMGGIRITTDILNDYAMSKSYINQTLTFMVPDYNRSKFTTCEAF